VIDRRLQRYVKGGSWRCRSPDNPTFDREKGYGAHYWVGDDLWMECKYCHRRRRAPQKPVIAPVTYPPGPVEGEPGSQ